jgi:hypothetical protein
VALAYPLSNPSNYVDAVINYCFVAHRDSQFACDEIIRNIVIDGSLDAANFMAMVPTLPT